MTPGAATRAGVDRATEARACPHRRVGSPEDPAPQALTTRFQRIASLRVAVHGRETEFVDVVCWRQLAEFAGRYLTKGRLVYVQGRLHGRTWQAEDGTTRRSAEVIAEDLQALDRPPAGGEEPAPQPEQG